MTKSSVAPGAFVLVPLGDDHFGYGRALQDDIHFAFYDSRTETEQLVICVIASKPVLFKVAVPRRRGTDECETSATENSSQSCNTRW